MSDTAAKTNNVVSLDVETNVQTTEGRIFLNQLNSVSHVLHLKDTTVQFQGQQLLKTGYISDFKSVQLYKCPAGYFLFADMAFGKNNKSWIAKSSEELLQQIQDEEIKNKVSAVLSESADD